MNCLSLAPSFFTVDFASSFDLTLLYLSERFAAASARLAVTTGADQLTCLRDLSAIAAAMTQIPADKAAGILAKREVAAWNFLDPAGQRLTLLPEIIAALEK